MPKLAVRRFLAAGDVGATENRILEATFRQLLQRYFEQCVHVGRRLANCCADLSASYDALTLKPSWTKR
jgi:hypothetical protein